MPTFAYAARDRAGKLVEGRSRAAAEGDLRRELQGAGLMLVRAKAESARRRSVTGKVKAKDIILFTFNMHNVLDSGVPLLTGLQDMIAETRQPRLKRVLEEILESVTGGETFSQALARHPDVFDPLYVHMCEAGEQSGRLPYAMERLMQFLEWREEFRHRIKDLVTYPIVVVFALAGLVGLVVGVVFPRFAEVFERVNFELPWSTRFLLGLSDLLTTYWWACLIGMALAWALGVFLKSIPPIKMALHTAVLKVPVVGDLISMLNFGQVANSLASFVDSGIPIPSALELIEKIVPNVRVAVSVKTAREGILGGKTLA
ncbi:MAG: type II secretion system F family protein, partial [Gemmatimonadetes bacterium]|nr:type II secretion system F family protein [Gemmatimonadota bacterium]